MLAAIGALRFTMMRIGSFGVVGRIKAAAAFPESTRRVASDSDVADVQWRSEFFWDARFTRLDTSPTFGVSEPTTTIDASILGGAPSETLATTAASTGAMNASTSAIGSRA